MIDTTPRYRKLKSGGSVFWHPCCKCGALDAPYGYGVARQSHGQWVDERDYRGHKTGKKLWQGKPATVNHGTWYCVKCRPETTGETTSLSSSPASE